MTPDEFDTCVDFWSYLADAQIAPALAKLALKALSAIVQSATCERLFSAFLWFHSARRNRLAAKKVFYSSEAKRAVQRKDEEEELAEMNRRCFNREDVMKKKKIVRLVNPVERKKHSGYQYSEIYVADVEPVLPDADELEVSVLCACVFFYVC